MFYCQLCNNNREVTKEVALAELRKNTADYIGGDDDHYRWELLQKDIDIQLIALRIGPGRYRCPGC
jgi:hypothetical protein